ncbi:TetR/AcrR family transcriptional regulator [Vibrio sp. WXL103]|uniref:TetR/AcrR family transcriptional regulator n=1 Tax=Vibrio sp. WXL103 TaxID=3450710 RepID=UPI003EC94692
MSKIAQLQHREQKILDVVMDLLSQHTVFELKMSDVCRVASCSMGVIYSHFPSKEDLLLACVHNLFRQELDCVTELLASEEDALDQMLIASMAFWIAAEGKPNNYTLKQFAINPHVWNAATITRVNALTELISEFSAQLHSVSERLFDHYQLGISEHDSDQFMLGLFGLTIGLHQHSISEFGGIIGRKRSQGKDANQHYKQLLIRYLCSWGIDESDIVTRFERLNQKITATQFYQQSKARVAS